MIFSSHDSDEKNCFITVNNASLMNTDKTVHLGHSLSRDNKDSIINGAIAQFWKSFNVCFADFGHISLYMQCKVFKEYCCSFNGAPL